MSRAVSALSGTVSSAQIHRTEVAQRRVARAHSREERMLAEQTALPGRAAGAAREALKRIHSEEGEHVMAKSSKKQVREVVLGTSLVGVIRYLAKNLNASLAQIRGVLEALKVAKWSPTTVSIQAGKARHGAVAPPSLKADEVTKLRALLAKVPAKKVAKAGKAPKKVVKPAGKPAKKVGPSF
jgi:hypothetical protein